MVFQFNDLCFDHHQDDFYSTFSFSFMQEFINRILSCFLMGRELTVSAASEKWWKSNCLFCFSFSPTLLMLRVNTEARRYVKELWQKSIKLLFSCVRMEGWDTRNDPKSSLDIQGRERVIKLIKAEYLQIVIVNV